ncbi:DnaJ family domain-containing protein [Pseudooceanicola algae]|uniref:DnaJ homologue subfamily C member 28 conserved domain-containing protein n=1 Tax=Pseudooceanicola algae TaxID=1537215 RepID=A0A418SH28_9RHOB|nr:DUF1992 domain-containing protein [Pseudooceanicola algae]QPM90351.1 hypothetical protein PSAL_015890 [Pseudooceanicola algae]
MDHPLIDLINARIEKAEAEGAFDDLPGAGQPLPDCDDPENALLNRLMQEAGGAPEFVTLARSLKTLRAELAEEGDRSRRREILKEMSMTEARMDIARRDWSR